MDLLSLVQYLVLETLCEVVFVCCGSSFGLCIEIKLLEDCLLMNKFPYQHMRIEIPIALINHIAQHVLEKSNIATSLMSENTVGI